MKKFKMNWKKIIAVFCCLVLFSGIDIYTSRVKEVKAATVGQQLNAPEAGWQRINCTDSKFIYQNKDSWVYQSMPDLYYTKTAGLTITFKFMSTRLRILSYPLNNRCSDATITIDGDTETLSAFYSPSGDSNVLIYDKSNLTNAMHTAVITSGTNADYKMLLESIDIDSSGYLIDPSTSTINVAGISLDKTSLDMQVGDANTLTATVVPSNATNKNVAWSSSDTSIATVDSTGKVTAIKEGAATITAKTVDGTNLSATCTVNIKNLVSGNALLTVTMIDGQQRSYDLTMDQVNDFRTWYNNRAGGSGSFIYSFNKVPSSAAYTKRTEYLIFDKISNFDVDEYKAN